MKKLIIGILLVLFCIPLLLSIVLAVAYVTTGQDKVPTPTLLVEGQPVAPNGYEWNVPVFEGILQKEFARSPSLEGHNAGTITEEKLLVEFPQGYQGSFSLMRDGKAVTDGTAAQWQDYILPQNGEYVLDITIIQPQSLKNKPSGRFSYRVYFTLQIEPVLETSGTAVSQGDVLAIRISRLPEDVLPTLETTIPNITKFGFMYSGPGQAVAFVPVSYYCDVGEYVATVRAGSYEWEIPFTAVHTDFERQEVTIDTSIPSVGAANTQEAINAYNNAILPLYEVTDNQMHWQGMFIWPVKGRISSSYGLRRYFNGSTTPTRHAGIDIAVDEGTPIVAPAAGRVLYADFLDRTGYSIVIEHGGGLKTYYYHMLGIHVQVGAMVAQGDHIGDVGSTGNSTGPHLHFDVKIANQSINPMPLLEGKGNLYYFL